MSDQPSAEPPSPPGLGEDIDDYCSRCRGLATHAVSAVLDGKVHRVMCRACLSEHKYRHGKGGKSKEAERKKLIEEVLKSSPYRNLE